VNTNGGSEITTIYKRSGDKTNIESKQTSECSEIKDMLIKISTPTKHKLLFEPTQCGTIHEFNVYHFGTHTDNVFGLEDINVMFNRFLQEIMKWIEQPIWNFVEINPTTNLIQVLILKLSDVDKHVEHLEKMVASLVEDNTLMNNRIKALETRLRGQAEIPVAEPIAEHITVAEAVLGYSLPK
jgi:hypothetical protein